MSDEPLPAAKDGVSPHGRAHASGPVVGGVIGRLTRVLALAGGAMLLLAVVVTLISVTGRYVFSQPVPGDYELVELICAIAVFLCFPYTHAANGNISALFFTSGLPVRYQRWLDLIHDVIFMVIAALLTWRLAAGLSDKFSTGDGTILLRIPFWWAYSVAVLTMALLTIVCIWRIAAGVKTVAR